MSENQAVWVALLNNAAFQEAASDLGLAQADLIQAKTLPNPTLSLLLPIGPKQLEFGIKHPIEALWLRPKRIALAQLDLEKTTRSLNQTSLDLVRDVRLAYTDLTTAKDRIALAKQSLDLANESAEIVEARHQAGSALELELTTVSTEQLQAKHELESLDSEALLATHRLSKLLGLGTAKMAILASTLPPTPTVPPSADSLLKEAFAARPDLRAAEIGIERAVQNAGLAESEAHKLTAILDTNGSGNAFEAGPGFEFPITLFDQNKAAKSRAKTMITSAAKHYLVVRDQIILDVRQSQTLAQQAQRSAAAWDQKIIPQLTLAAKQAEAAYKGGSIPFLQVITTKQNLNNARLKHLEARANLHRALIELDRAVGHKISK